jgi:hypothetical protein
VFRIDPGGQLVRVDKRVMEIGCQMGRSGIRRRALVGQHHHVMVTVDHHGHQRVRGEPPSDGEGVEVACGESRIRRYGERLRQIGESGRVVERAACAEVDAERQVEAGVGREREMPGGLKAAERPSGRLKLTELTAGRPASTCRWKLSSSVLLSRSSAR